MMSNISWQNFLVIMGSLLAGWYGVVGWMYYRRELVSMLGKSWWRLSGATNKRRLDDSANEKAAGSIVRAQQLQEEINAVLQKADRLQYPREELLLALQGSLRNYPELQQAGFRVAINHYIEKASERQCSTPLGEEDLRRLWAG